MKDPHAPNSRPNWMGSLNDRVPVFSPLDVIVLLAAGPNKAAEERAATSHHRQGRQRGIGYRPRQKEASSAPFLHPHRHLLRPTPHQTRHTTPSYQPTSRSCPKRAWSHRHPRDSYTAPSGLSDASRGRKRRLQHRTARLSRSRQTPTLSSRRGCTCLGTSPRPVWASSTRRYRQQSPQLTARHSKRRVYPPRPRPYRGRLEDAR